MFTGRSGRLDLSASALVYLLFVLQQGRVYQCQAWVAVMRPDVTNHLSLSSSSRRWAFLKLLGSRPNPQSKKAAHTDRMRLDMTRLFSSKSKSTPMSDLPYEYAERRQFDDSLLGDLTGGRPGAIIETAEQLELKEKILQTLDQRNYDPQIMQDYGELEELAEAEYDTDDPEALDEAELGTWTYVDLQSKFDYEWDPRSGDPDPNHVALQNARDQLLQETEKDDDGVEKGYSPYFGPSNPIDTRTILGTRDSYMIDPATRDESRLTPQFAPDDLELSFNEDVVRFRKSLDLMETYLDPFLSTQSADMEVPLHVAKWHGYPELTHFKPQNFTNNRFTAPQNRTDFSKLTPFRARQLAVEMARSQNAEWMPAHVSLAAHAKIRQPYEKYQTLVGTLRKGECEAAIVEQMQPALAILGSCVDLLSITKVENENYNKDNKNNQLELKQRKTMQDSSMTTTMALAGQENQEDDAFDESLLPYFTPNPEPFGLIIRFHYHGLIKNKYGMKCWTESLLREECGMLNVNNVIFETGFRKRDPAYEGGDGWYGPAY
ncbi:hypothetical protein ACA910_010538 [Epithemia clementina (nom. ined.)]